MCSATRSSPRQRPNCSESDLPAGVAGVETVRPQFTGGCQPVAPRPGPGPRAYPVGDPRNADRPVNERDRSQRVLTRRPLLAKASYTKPRPPARLCLSMVLERRPDLAPSDRGEVPRPRGGAHPELSSAPDDAGTPAARNSLTVVVWSCGRVVAVADGTLLRRRQRATDVVKEATERCSVPRSRVSRPVLLTGS